MNQPLVSVCVPTWNREAYLPTTLESVLVQTYPHLEVLVLDNDSTDGTVDVARAFAARDARVRVFANESNIGGMPNYRRLLQLASGDYVKFCNSDDVLLPGAIERMLPGLAESNVGIVVARQMFVDDTMNPLPAQPPVYGAGTGLLRGTELADISFVTGKNLFGCPTGVMFRRADLAADQWCQFGGHTLWNAGDLATWLTLAAGRDVAYLAEQCILIRLHDEAETYRDPANRVLEQVDWVALAARAPAYGYLQDPQHQLHTLARCIRALSAMPDLVEPSEWSPIVADSLRWAAEASATLLGGGTLDPASRLDFHRRPDQPAALDGGGVPWVEVTSDPAVSAGRVPSAASV